MKLKGLRVVDLSVFLPGPYLTLALADHGAEVIKIEPPDGDPTRRIGVADGPTTLYFRNLNRGKKSVVLNLKEPRDRDRLLRLAATADVFVESFRPGVVDRLGVGYEDVKARNAGIVYCSTSGYGQSGPYSQYAGHDLNYLGVGGYLAASEAGEGGKPIIPGTTVADSAAGGMHAVMSICAALVARGRTGEGAFLDVSVADGALQLMALHIEDHLATGVQPGHRHTITTGRYACYDTYQASDGGWITVAAIEPKFWANFCNLIGLPQWAARQTDDDVQDQVRAEVADVIRTKARDEWVALLAPADTCVAPVLTVAEVVDDPQLVGRGDFPTASHPTAGEFRQLGPTLGGQVREAHYELRAGDVTDTDELLAASGLSADDIAKLHDAGVIQ